MFFGVSRIQMQSENSVPFLWLPLGPSWALISNQFLFNGRNALYRLLSVSSFLHLGFLHCCDILGGLRVKAKRDTIRLTHVLPAIIGCSLFAAWLSLPSNLVRPWSCPPRGRYSCLHPCRSSLLHYILLKKHTADVSIVSSLYLHRRANGPVYQNSMWVNAGLKWANTLE